MLSSAWLVNVLCGSHPYLNTRFRNSCVSKGQQKAAGQRYWNIVRPFCYDYFPRNHMIAFTLTFGFV